MAPDIAATAALTFPAGASTSEVTQGSQTVDGAYSGGMPCLVQSRFCPAQRPRHTERDARSWLHNYVFTDSVASGAELDFRAAGGGVYGLALAPRQESDEPHGHTHARLLIDVSSQGKGEKAPAKRASKRSKPAGGDNGKDAKNGAGAASGGKGKAVESPPTSSAAKAPPNTAAKNDEGAADNKNAGMPADHDEAGMPADHDQDGKKGKATAPAPVAASAPAPSAAPKAPSDDDPKSSSRSAAKPAPHAPAKPPVKGSDAAKGSAGAPGGGASKAGGNGTASDEGGNIFSDSLKAWGWDFSWEDLKQHAWRVFGQSGPREGGWTAQMALEGAACTPGWVPVLVGDDVADDDDVLGWRAGADTWRGRCVRPVPLALNQPTRVCSPRVALAAHCSAPGCVLYVIGLAVYIRYLASAATLQQAATAVAEGRFEPDCRASGCPARTPPSTSVLRCLPAQRPSRSGCGACQSATPWRSASRRRATSSSATTAPPARRGCRHSRTCSPWCCRTSTQGRDSAARKARS